VCGYTVYKWASELPFKVVLLDRQSGDAKLVLAEGARLDYELRRKYSFDIAAYDCQTGAHAPRSGHKSTVQSSHLVLCGLTSSHLVPIALIGHRHLVQMK